MAIGAPGQAEFVNLINQARNLDIAAGLAPLMDFREEVTRNDELTARGGFDNATQTHFLRLLARADKLRRRVSYNPEKKELGDLIQQAIDPNGQIEPGERPWTGDNIQHGTGGRWVLPWDFSGADPNIPLSDTLTMSNNGMLLLHSINRAIVTWTRLESRNRNRQITVEDSLRVYDCYAMIYDYLQSFGGDTNRADFAQVRATEEPRGAANAPNSKTETPNLATAAR
jgi:hypothetical protein